VRAAAWFDEATRSVVGVVESEADAPEPVFVMRMALGDDLVRFRDVSTVRWGVVGVWWGFDM
jgi:hypothetical protein